MARVMVLCAGLGTRLRPLTNEVPKALLPLGDRSFLAHLFTALEGAGLGHEIVVNTHHLASEFERAGPAFDFEINLIYEPEIRGTAGGIAGALDRLGPPPVVVLTGDILLDSVPADFAETARDGGMVLAVVPTSAGSGSVGVGSDGQVVRLRGERFGEEVRGGEYVGLLALGARSLSELPERGCYVADYALPLLRRGGRIETFAYSGTARFPGDSLRAYLDANLEWLDERGGSFVAPGAEVHPGVVLEQALVGSGARVLGAGRVARSLIFPGATARAPLEEAIVLPSGRVVAVEV